MKKAEAESLHRNLISDWFRREKPQKDEHGLVDFCDYLKFAREKRPDCLDFRCRAGSLYEVERWFDSMMGQNWVR